MSDNTPVPYVNFSPQHNEIRGELLQAFEKVLDSGNYILGPEVAAFEKDFASYCQAEFATGISNGTCALHLVMRGLGLNDGDEVITTPNSFLASASSIALTGARPVFVDIGQDLNIDVTKIEAAITPHTKAIMPVHLTGRPARMVEILEIAKKYNLFVLEDAAQAVGAKLKNKPVGAWGDAACFSLHPLKNLRALGDAGMMTTNDSATFEKMLKSRNHGFKNRNECEFWSFNCRLDEVHAAMLRVQLRSLDRWTEERRQLAFRYNKLLASHVEVPLEGKDEFCVYQTYVVKADRRDALQKYLLDRKIDVKVHYPIPIHLQEAAKDLGYQANDFPETMKASERILSLPLYPGLKEEQQNRVVQLIKEFYAS